ncbi:hypothetical protein ACYVVD_06240 [Arenicellales bacterium IMCC58067]
MTFSAFSPPFFITNPLTDGLALVPIVMKIVGQTVRFYVPTKKEPPKRLYFYRGFGRREWDRTTDHHHVKVASNCNIAVFFSTIWKWQLLGYSPDQLEKSAIGHDSRS